MSPAAALVLVFACMPAAAVAGSIRPRWSGRVGAIGAVLAAAGIGWAWARGGGTALDLAWIPAIGARLTLELDDLGAPYAILACGVGGCVTAYASGYLPLHLKHEGRPARDEVAFHAWMLAFMAAMVVLLTAKDLVLLFVALDLTALASYFLIRFDRDREEARRSALVAVVTTAGTSLLFLIGALLVRQASGSLAVGSLAVGSLAVGSAPRASVVASACLAAGVLAKSAQFPLHFWLPRAMVAPTPVSAYLHSAAMVAAGVFVLQRLRPMLDPAVLEALFWLGIASIAAGSALALVADPLKEVLAYSTIAQYGYVLALVGLGGAEGAAGAPLFVVVHGLCKSALFMAVGVVTMRTGASRLSEAGGCARDLPWLAAGSAVAAAGLAGLPLTAGYFKDELFFAAAWHRGPLAGAMAAIAVAATLAYAARFWLGIFAGKRAEGVTLGPGPPVAPILVLAALIVAGGVVSAPLEALARRAGSAVAARSSGVGLAYHFEARSETLLALVAWGMGALLVVSRGRWEAGARAGVVAVARRLGPARAARNLARLADRISTRLHAIELRDLRDRIGAMLLPTALFVVFGAVMQGSSWPSPRFELASSELPLALAVVAVAAAALVVVKPASHFLLLLMISFVGFGLGLCFGFAAAPDVALVAVLIETTFTLLFMGLLARIAPRLLARARAEASRSRRRDRLAAVAVGVVATVVSWSALSRRIAPSVALEHVHLSRAAHAGDVVSAILTDFRGLDTAGEISVLAAAVLGAWAVKGVEERR